MTIVCHKCSYYYVTWEPFFPHGCRAMNFKGKRLPINEVRMTMQGKDCLAFKVKKQSLSYRDQGAMDKR